MAYTDQTQYPRGLFWTSTLLSTTPQVVSALDLRMAWALVTNTGAAARILTFRRPSAGATYFNVNLGTSAQAGGYRLVPAAFFGDGLELVTNNAAADIAVALAYYDD